MLNEPDHLHNEMTGSGDNNLQVSHSIFSGK